LETPRIQYTRTVDGVSIAYYSVGEGLPIVFMPTLPFSHIEHELKIPEWREAYERLGRDRRLVRYDARGTGLSDRSRVERDIDSMVLDLEAVVDKLGLERFALRAMFYAAGPAIAYAVRHPERVSHLLLFCGFSRFEDLNSSQLAAVRSLVQRDWHLYSLTAAHVLLGWEQGAPAERAAEFIRESASPEAVTAIFDAEYDVTDLLASVSVPALVQHRRGIPWLPIDVGFRLASGIPEARFEVLEGTSIAPYLGDSGAVLRGIDSFLDDREPDSKAPAAGGLQTIVFTDLQNQSDLIQRLGDERGRAVLRDHERLTRDAIRAGGGREIKSMGNGFMASFGSAQMALQSAIRLQREVESYNQPRVVDEQLRLRVGINAGEPISEADDLFGESVIATARIAAAAAGGEVLVANVVRELAAGKGFHFSPRGAEVLRGFEEPTELYELTWRS
jgi:class 3 adenylate cyclase/pimeloyl-ACP methyl ester carboxylesterase